MLRLENKTDNAVTTFSSLIRPVLEASNNGVSNNFIHSTVLVAPHFSSSSMIHVIENYYKAVSDNYFMQSTAMVAHSLFLTPIWSIVKTYVGFVEPVDHYPAKCSGFTKHFGTEVDRNSKRTAALRPLFSNPVITKNPGINIPFLLEDLHTIDEIQFLQSILAWPEFKTLKFLAPLKKSLEEIYSEFAKNPAQAMSNLKKNLDHIIEVLQSQCKPGFFLSTYNCISRKDIKALTFLLNRLQDYKKSLPDLALREAQLQNPGILGFFKLHSTPDLIACEHELPTPAL